MPHLNVVQPAEIGFDSLRLERAYAILDQWTAGPNAPIPGGAILVGRDGRTVEPRFFGRQGPEADAPPIRADGQFLLASITKPLTYTAAMMLLDRGELTLSDPVVRYIPEFAANHKNDVRLLHLMTHTSGMPDMLPNNVELRRQHASLEEFTKGAIEAAPLFPPGTDVSYQSMGTLVTSEIVQRVSGLPIHEFLRREVFDPLGMKDTALGSRGLDEARLVRVEVPEFQVGSDFNWNSRYWRELGVPWGGLFSTPSDFAVLLAMFLNHGEIGGVRLLSPAAVRAMTTNRLETMPDIPEPQRRTQGWGLGWKIVVAGTPGSYGDLLSPRAFGHTGATGTMVWMDPESGAFALIFTTGLRANAPSRLVHISNALAGALVA
jgi:CubicO group peptidase (beta-lactamase class C family)